MKMDVQFAKEFTYLLLAFLRLACPALGRGAPLLFSLMKKVTKKSSQQRGFFCRTGLRPEKLIKPRAA
jgi:hypothetical protein